jgi:hypothetical protein
MHRTFRHLATFALVGLAACNSTDSGGPQELILDFDLALETLNNWSFGSSDYQASQEAAVEFQSDKRPLPPDLSGAAFYHAGTNISDDLWMFFARKVTGLMPGGTYRVRFQLDFVTNYHSGCTVGVGASVWIKAGAAGVEPMRVLSGDGSWRMNVDKGEQISTGTDAVLLGDIRNGLPDCPAQPEFAENNDQPEGTLEAVADPTGAIWLFFGTESGFEVRHEIYFTRFTVGIRPG